MEYMKNKNMEYMKLKQYGVQGQQENMGVHGINWHKEYIKNK